MQMMNSMMKKKSKKLTNKELLTKRLKKKWRDLGYNKIMPFMSFRLLAKRTKL